MPSDNIKKSPPVDFKQAALTQLIELQKTCKIKDVISPIDEKWDVLIEQPKASI